MKNYRLLLPIVMIAVMLVSWYTLINDAKKTDNEYNRYLTEARKYAADGITKFAIQNYTHALEVKNSAELYAEVSAYYKSQGEQKANLSWCEGFLKAYPTTPMAYDYMLEAYLEDKDYAACFKIIDVAGKRNISTDYISSVSEEIKYVYHIDYSIFDDVGTYTNNYCAVKTKDHWGFADAFGELRIPCRYTETRAFTKAGIASVVSEDGSAYFIDKSGSKVKVSKEKYLCFGLAAGDRVAALRTDGKYTYLNYDLQVLFGEYDYASTFNGGVAAVKTGTNWQLIDVDGNSLTDAKYQDVKLDENFIAYRNDRSFVSAGNGYIMINSKGKQIGTLKFEDAKMFASAAPTAVCIDGKWRFANDAGTLISDKTYEAANSFCNGLAAVCVNGKWGFVDEEENMVIAPEFDGAKSFNEKGSCFVLDGGKWKLLKLYRLNKEK